MTGIFTFEEIEKSFNNKKFSQIGQNKIIKNLD